MGKFRTHYDNLQVARNASPEVIRAAYKGLTQRYHPDRNSHEREQCERIMKVIGAAYTTLSDPQMRAEHDAWIASQEAVAEAETTISRATTDASNSGPNPADFSSISTTWRESRVGADSRDPRASGSATTDSRSTPKYAAQVPRPEPAGKWLAIAFGVVLAMGFVLYLSNSMSLAILAGGVVTVAVVGGAIFSHVRKMRATGNHEEAVYSLSIALTIVVWAWLPLAGGLKLESNLISEAGFVFIATGLAALIPARVAVRALLTDSLPDVRWAAAAGSLLLMAEIFATVYIVHTRANDGNPLAPIAGMGAALGTAQLLGSAFGVAVTAAIGAAALVGVAVLAVLALAGIDGFRRTTTEKPRAIGLLIGWAAIPVLVLVVIGARLLH